MNFSRLIPASEILEANLLNKIKRPAVIDPLSQGGQLGNIFKERNKLEIGAQELMPIGQAPRELGNREFVVVKKNEGVDFNRQYAQDRGMLTPGAKLRRQQMGAVESGEDQVTGRVMQELQRNEDIDTQQTSAVRFLANARERISRFLDIDPSRVASLRGDTEGADLSTGRIEKELIKEFGADAYQNGPKASARRQALELYASTGDPKLLETVRLFGLSPATFEQESNLSSGRRGVMDETTLELYKMTGDPTLLDTVEFSPATFKQKGNLSLGRQSILDERRAMETRGLPSENLIPVIAKTGTMINLPGYGRVDLADIRRPVVTEDTALAANDWVSSNTTRKQENLLNFQTEQAEEKAALLAATKQKAEVTGMALKAKKDNSWTEEHENALNELRNRYRRVPSELKQKVLEEGQILSAKKDNAIANNMIWTAEEENQLKNARIIYSHPELENDTNIKLKQIAKGLITATTRAEEETNDLTKKYPTTLMDWSGESKRLFAEFDENGNIIPGTEEIRAERRAMDLPSKGGGGRNIAEYTVAERGVESRTPISRGIGQTRDYYDDVGQAAFPWWETEDNSDVGRQIDIYGIRPSNIRKDLDYKIPSSPNYTKEERDIFLSGQSDTAKNRQRFYREYETQPVTPQGIRSIPVSSELVRLQRTGAPGEAQAFLDRLKKEYMNG